MLLFIYQLSYNLLLSFELLIKINVHFTMRVELLILHADNFTSQSESLEF